MEQLKDFNKLEYKRIDFDATKEILDKLINDLKTAENFNDFLSCFKRIINIQNEIEEMYDYADIRNMRDSKDSFFDSEINYWNTYKPKFDSLFVPFHKTILKSNFKSQLKSFVPENFFQTIEYQNRVTDESITDLYKEEQELKKEYRSLLGDKVTYEGKFVNLSTLVGYLKDSDRQVRKTVSDLYNEYFYERKDNFDDIFMKLINVRKKIATSLNFKDYKEYSLYKLRRYGYDYKEISEFRDNIRTFINPIIKRLIEIKKENLGLEELYYYDTIFFSESPKPLYEGEELLDNLGLSLQVLDKELYEFYTEMLKKNYIDLENRDNKVAFSITNYLCGLGLPTITGSFKGTYFDIKMTSHELGHAYQKYNASIKDKEYIVSPLLKYPTMEVAEMFSDAMVIILLPYLKNIFSESDYNKYCIQVLHDLISLLPYICLVDEFQERIYTKKNIKVEEIHNTWLELAKKYGLENQNKGNKNLDEGCYFFRQNHIFLDPFYYIDYAISTIGALSIASSCEKDLEVFKNASGVASYYSIDEISKLYNFPNPFKKDSIKHLAKNLESTLNKYYNK